MPVGAHVVMRPAAGFHGLKLHVSAQPESELAPGLLQAALLFKCSMRVSVQLLLALFKYNCSMLMSALAFLHP